MMHAMQLTFACVLLSVLTDLAPAQSAVDSTLHMVDSLYTVGSYSLAELEARRLLENDLLSDSIHVVAQQWVAFALVAQGRTALAKDRFLDILRLRPSYELDPIFTSPKILAVYNEARAKFRVERLEDTNRAGSTSTGRPDRITFRTILFPGWEQLYHGRTTIGAILAGAGVATLGAGIVLEFLRRSARQEYLSATTPEDIETKYNTYNRYSKAEVYSFVAFAVAYLTSEIEVFAHANSVSLSSGAADHTNPGGTLVLSLTIR